MLAAQLCNFCILLLQFWQEVAGRGANIHVHKSIIKVHLREKNFPSTWQDFIHDFHRKVYYPYTFSVQARQNSHHVKHEKFLKGLMQRQGDDEGKSEQQQANHPVREELGTYCVRGKALRGRQSTRKGS